MVQSVNQNVLEFVKTKSLVITPMVCVLKDVMMVGQEHTVQKYVDQIRTDQIVFTRVDTVQVTSHVIEQLGSVTEDVNLDTLENCVTQVVKMKSLVLIVAIIVVEIVYFKILAIQLMDIVITDVNQDI